MWNKKIHSSKKVLFILSLVNVCHWRILIRNSLLSNFYLNSNTPKLPFNFLPSKNLLWGKFPKWATRGPPWAGRAMVACASPRSIGTWWRTCTNPKKAGRISAAACSKTGLFSTAGAVSLRGILGCPKWRIPCNPHRYPWSSCKWRCLRKCSSSDVRICWTTCL